MSLSSRKFKFSAVIVSAALLLVGFQNCADSLPDVVKYADLGSALPATPLALVGNRIEVSPNGTIQLPVVGGMPPYQFSMVSGHGAVNYSGMFVAPGAPETNVVKVTHTGPGALYIDIDVVAGLVLVFNPVLTYSTEALTLSATGGSPPYTFALISGPGSLSGITYTPAAAAGTAVIRITDSAARTRDVSLPITAVPRRPVTKLLDGADPVYLFDPEPGVRAGFVSQGVSFSYFTMALANTRPVIHCRLGTIDFESYYVVSPGVCPAGYANHGTVGYVSTVARPNTVPLYGSPGLAHFTSREQADVAAQGVTPEIVGYVIP